MGMRVASKVFLDYPAQCFEPRCLGANSSTHDYDWTMGGNSAGPYSRASGWTATAFAIVTR